MILCMIKGDKLQIRVQTYYIDDYYMMEPLIEHYRRNTVKRSRQFAARHLHHLSHVMRTYNV